MISRCHRKDELDYFFSHPVDQFYTNIINLKNRKNKMEKIRNDSYDLDSSQNDSHSTDGDSEGTGSFKSVSSVFNQNCFEKTNCKIIRMRQFLNDGWEKTLVIQKMKHIQIILKQREVKNCIKSCINLGLPNSQQQINQNRIYKNSPNFCSTLPQSHFNNFCQFGKN